MNTNATSGTIKIEKEIPCTSEYNNIVTRKTVQRKTFPKTGITVANILAIQRGTATKQIYNKNKIVMVKKKQKTIGTRKETAINIPIFLEKTKFTAETQEKLVPLKLPTFKIVQVNKK